MERILLFAFLAAMPGWGSAAYVSTMEVLIGLRSIHHRETNYASYRRAEGYVLGVVDAVKRYSHLSEQMDRMAETYLK